MTGLAMQERTKTAAGALVLGDSTLSLILTQSGLALKRCVQFVQAIDLNAQAVILDGSSGTWTPTSKG